MQVGFAVPTSGAWATPEAMLRVGRRAEELGYHALWTFQRLLTSAAQDWAEVYRSVADPIVALSYLAGNTSRVRLGLGVVNIPFFSPALLAKQLATLDVVSGGRLDAGLGLGWSPEELTASGASPAGRGRRAEEFISAVRALWTQDVTAFSGEFYEIPAARMEPKPVQRPHPPIILGGFAGPALRRAGRLAEGWISSSRADLTRLGETISAVQDAATQAGRNPAPLRFICRGVVRVRPAGAADRRLLTGSYAEIRGDFDVLAEQGVTELFVDLNYDPAIGSPDADVRASLQRAEETLEAFAPGAQ
jgi:probable F420-dependent oxidoreductase